MGAIFARMVYENKFVRSVGDHKFVNMRGKNINVENVCATMTCKISVGFVLIHNEQHVMNQDNCSFSGISNEKNTTLIRLQQSYRRSCSFRVCFQLAGYSFLGHLLVTFSEYLSVTLLVHA